MGQGSGARIGAPRGQDSGPALNRVYLSGVLAADPTEDEGRDGKPVTLLLVAFPAPDPTETEERPAVASQEVEVPQGLLKRGGRGPRAGESIFITGQFGGGGAVIATEVHSGPPPEQAR